jgi:hypothetical protein
MEIESKKRTDSPLMAVRALERPDLEFNGFYPYYMQMESGAKKGLNKIETVMRISDNSGILICQRYRKRKISEITIERTKIDHTLERLRKEGYYISYPDFAEEVGTVHHAVYHALKRISEAKAYRIGNWETVYFKSKGSISFEFESEKISVLYENHIEENEAGKNEEVENGEFEKQLKKTWNFFTAYFKCPTFLHKTQYEPRLKK